MSSQYPQHAHSSSQQHQRSQLYSSQRGGYQVASGTAYLSPSSNIFGRNPSPVSIDDSASHTGLAPSNTFSHYAPQHQREYDAQRQDYGRSPSPEYPTRGPSAVHTLASVPTPNLPPSPPLHREMSNNGPGLGQHDQDESRWGRDTEDWASRNHPRNNNESVPDAPRGNGQGPNAQPLNYNRPFQTPLELQHLNTPNDTAYRPMQSRHSTQASDSSLAGLTARAGPLGLAAEGDLSTLSLPYDGRQEPSEYARSVGNDRFNHYQTAYGGAAPLGAINPHDIADDDGDPQMYARKKPRDTSGAYGQVPGGGNPEKGRKSTWLNKQGHDNKRLKWMVGGLIIGVIALAIIGGVVGVVVTSNKSSSSTTAPGNAVITGPTLTKDSSAVQALMNNANLHRVFPGVDYTPLNAQYPACLQTPPQQNNVTLDIAVLSQLSPEIRLYGTDCNQTELVLNAIKDLGLQDSVKVWLGVWLANNATTNTRQLAQMYDVIDKYGTDQLAGFIIGNEILFRDDMTVTELADVLTAQRAKLRAQGITLPVATSDIGSKWTVQLAEASDIVMANIHPFFGGVAASNAASWTWNYWQTTDVVLTQGLSGKSNIISETGWPSAGGNDCSPSTSCATSTQGAVAGVDEMNTFLGEWVCNALTNGTKYFWFEAFDEPWKIIYNTPTEQWEDKWGLMDVNRNLKSGLTIPDCGSANL